MTSELAYTLEMERFEAEALGTGADPTVPVTLRVTTVFRPEDGDWRARAPPRGSHLGGSAAGMVVEVLR